MIRVTPSIRLLAAIAATAFAVLAFTIQPFDPFGYGGDLWVYLAAGERLNAGHDLYALSPGDRPVPLNPPYWTTPLLAPPLVAVVWRPLAALAPIGPALWWAAGAVAMGLMAYDLLRRGGPVAVLGTIALAPALALTAASGNANALLTPLLYLAWTWRHRDVAAGTAIAISTGIKLTPAFAGVWLAGHRPRRAVGAAGLVIGLLAVLSLAGAGIDAHVDWLRTAVPTRPAPLSLAAITGLPAIAISAIAGLIVLAVAALKRERATFAVAIVMATLATPALYFTALAGLGAALAADRQEG